MCKQKKYHLRSPPRFTLCNLLLILLVALQTWKECEGRIGNGATCAGKKVAIPFGCHQGSWSCCGSKPYCNRSPGSLMARQACCGGRLIDLGHLSCSKGLFICCGGKAMCSRNNRRQACFGGIVKVKSQGQTARDSPFPFSQLTRGLFPLQARPSGQVKPDDTKRVLIEWCTGKNSRLGQIKFAKDCEVVRITEDDDARTYVAALKAASAGNVETSSEPS